MNYDLLLLDPEHKEAYMKCTDLLKVFMDRQWYLHKQKHTTLYQPEKLANSVIINLLHWVRYHLIGNDDVTIQQKCHIDFWTFRGGPIYIGNSEIAREQFDLGDDKDIKMTYPEVVELIIKAITPVHNHSIFAVEDHIQESITLQKEIERMRDTYSGMKWH